MKGGAITSVTLLQEKP